MFTSLRLSHEPFASTNGRGRRIVELAAVGLVLTPTLLRALAAKTAGTDAEESALDTVVVTGSAIGGVKKLEASYNIVRASESNVTYSDVGDHTQNLCGLQQLGTYYAWNFGATATVGENWQFALRGTNVTDELGLTEGNSRATFGVAAGEGGVLLARSVGGPRDHFPSQISLVVESD